MTFKRHRDAYTSTRFRRQWGQRLIMNWWAVGYSTRDILRALVALDAAHQPVTYDQLAQHAQMPYDTLQRNMRKLLQERKVIRSGGPRGYLYQIQEPPAHADD